MKEGNVQVSNVSSVNSIFSSLLWWLGYVHYMIGYRWVCLSIQSSKHSHVLLRVDMTRGSTHRALSSADIRWPCLSYVCPSTPLVNKVYGPKATSFRPPPSSLCTSVWLWKSHDFRAALPKNNTLTSESVCFGVWGYISIQEASSIPSLTHMVGTFCLSLIVSVTSLNYFFQFWEYKKS